MSAESVEEVKCLICGSSQFSHFKDGDRNLNLEAPLRVVRCNPCGLLLLNPRPSPEARMEIFAGRKPKGFETYLSDLAHYGAVTKSRAGLFRGRIDILKKHYFSGKTISVLDVGSSSGEFLEAAEAIGWEAVGVEPSTEGAELARKKGLNVVSAPAEKVPFDNNRFDLVHSNHVFEHLADPLAAAKEAYRVLKPGGIVFIEVPNQFDNIQFFRYRLIGRVPVRKRNIRSIHHLVFFSRSALKMLLQNAGFQDVKILNKYGRHRDGLGYLGSVIMRFLGMFFLGAPIIQAVAKKKA